MHDLTASVIILVRADTICMPVHAAPRYHERKQERLSARRPGSVMASGLSVTTRQHRRLGSDEPPAATLTTAGSMRRIMTDASQLSEY